MLWYTYNYREIFIDINRESPYIRVNSDILSLYWLEIFKNSEAILCL